MKTQSHYIDDQFEKGQGLGRMPLRTNMLCPVLDEPITYNQYQQIKPRLRLHPISKPKPAKMPLPVIDKSPAAPTPALIAATNKTSENQQPTTTNSAGILKGSYAIGNLQVKKTHLAMGAGGIAGGLLLWKILF